MRRITFLSLTIISLCGSSAIAQYNTGSDDLNKTLVRVDADAGVNFSAFKADISGSYNITKKKIDYLAVRVGMSAGDIYMTVEIVKIARVSIDRVVEVYQSNRGKGWGVIAKQLGIKPGSAEFHALKGNAGKGKGNGNGNRGKSKKG
jgi:hypothetical protein